LGIFQEGFQAFKVLSYFMALYFISWRFISFHGAFILFHGALFFLHSTFIQIL